MFNQNWPCFTRRFFSLNIRWGDKFAYRPSYISSLIYAFSRQSFIRFSWHLILVAHGVTRKMTVTQTLANVLFACLSLCYRACSRIEGGERLGKGSGCLLPELGEAKSNRYLNCSIVKWLQTLTSGIKFLETDVNLHEWINRVNIAEIHSNV